MPKTGCGRWLAGIVVAVCALTAHGDVEETERRLKAAGVDEALSERIRESIRRGAKHLMARQKADGSWNEEGAPFPRYVDAGHTALCSLALSHAGTRDATAAARRGMEYLCPTAKGARHEAISFTYTAGILAMLLQCLAERPDVEVDIVRSLVAGQDRDSGSWGYYSPRQKAEQGTVGDLLNLSTAQFAALGLWAGARGGAELPREAWRRHVRGLCAFQDESGSWPYSARPGAGYPTGTFMGLADLVLARHALGDEMEDDVDLAARSELALAHGTAALDRDGLAAIEFTNMGRYVNYYQLYALEKVCTFLDAERIGGKRWFVPGAERLLAVQNPNGSWGSERPLQGLGLMPRRPDGDLTSTSFALLFLLRISMTFHPTTPRGIDTPPPTTPGAADEPKAREPAKGPRLPPPPRPVAMSKAESALSRVEAWLKAQKADPAGALAALEDVAAALRRLEPDPVAETASPASQMAREREFMEKSKAWRERAGSVLVDAVGSRSDAVATRAALALSAGPRSASIPLRSAIDRRLRSDDADDAPSRRLVDAAFGALADLGHADLLPWLATRVTDARDVLAIRSARAALAALTHFDGGERPARLAAARRVVRAVADIAARADAAKPDDLAGRTDAIHWRTLQPHAIAALQALCADDAGDLALGVEGRPLAAVPEFAAYLEVKLPK